MFLINKINLFHLKVTKICKNKIVKIRVYMHLLYARKYCSFKYLPFLNNFVSILEGRGRLHIFLSQSFTCSYNMYLLKSF